MANYLDTTGLTALWGKIKAWATAQFTTAKLVITGYSKPSTSAPLSATDTINQALGKLEKGIEGAASTVASHNHDDRYYTETEADGRFAPKSHTHTIANVTSLQGALDAKANSADVYTKTEADNKYRGKGSIPDSDIQITVSGIEDVYATLEELIPNIAVNNNVVHRNDQDESIDGVKSFQKSVNLQSGATCSGELNMASHKISGLANIGQGSTGFDAVNKNYVDGQISNVNSGLTVINQTISNIQSSIASGLVFKGTIGSGGTTTALPTSGYKVGNCYIVKTAGTYAGEVCEVGDMIVCTGVSGSTVTWNVIQNNLDLHPIATATIDALN